MKTIIEPFRVKMVEPIRMTTVEERQQYLKDVHYNLFGLKSDDVIIDLLTDSGTSSMSAKQWAAVMSGDESYAGSPSYFRFKEAIKNLMPFKHIIPTHQGRAAEAILFSVVGGEGVIIPNNTHFDTTKGNVETTGAKAVDLLIPEGKDTTSLHPFKGNMDVDALDKLLSKEAEQIPVVMLTITNNAGGGQPVSMANIKATRAVCDKYNKPLFIDSCRFAENAYFIKLREDGYADKSVTDIVREMFSYADGMTMSAKKDAFANIGGWLAMNDDVWAEEASNRLILTEGFPTYGGLAGRDLEAVAQGLKEIVDEDYLAYRLTTIKYMVDALDKAGIPVVKPAGGHAVFIDARKLLPHIPPLEYPGHALAVGLYELGGIRGCEIGTVMFGMAPDGTESPATLDLVRLAMPRRVYTQSQADYIIECMIELKDKAKDMKGFKITKQPKAMRHFTAQFERL
jgi:tryptophanase